MSSSNNGFSALSIMRFFAISVICLLPLASASAPLERDVPFYGPSSEYLDSSTRTEYQTPSESAQLYTSYSAEPTAYSQSYSIQPTGYPASYSSAAGTGVVPYPNGNATAPYPTGGKTHQVTPTTHHQVTSVRLTTVHPSAAATSTPEAASPNGAAAMARNLAGLVIAGTVAILAL